MRVLSFDSSSSTIGWAVFDISPTNQISLLTTNYIKPSKDGDIIDRLLHTRNLINDILNTYKPTHIAIEEIIKFMKGKSAADTIIMLTTFNRMICLASADYLSHSPKLFNVLSIRHGIKLNKIAPKKEEIPALVEKHLSITFPYVLISKGKNKGKPAPESFDMGDAVAVGLYYSFILTNKIKQKIKKSK